MARRPQQGQGRPFTQVYYIYDEHVGTTLGGHPVVEKDGHKAVVLMPAQAKFWLEQGLIGLETFDQQSAESQAVINQIRGKTVEQQQPQPQQQQPQVQGQAPAAPKE